MNLRAKVVALGPIGIGAVVTFVLVFAIGFAPLFGVPGYEHALATGLIAPSCAAICVALQLSGERRQPVSQLLAGASTGALYALVAFASAIVHGLRVGFCSVGGAAVYFVLTAAMGSVLGGVWGAFVAEGARSAKRRRLHAFFFGVAAPLLAIGISLARFYRSPMVFAYDPFVGYFGGTLYDTVIEPGTALLTYRLGSLATLGAAFFSASFFTRERVGTLRLRRDGAHRVARLATAALCAGASFAITINGPALGHWETPESIALALGAKHSGPRCDVIHGDDVSADAAELLVRDCEEQLASVEAVLGAKGPPRITAFMFRDAAEKKRLMGAADTYVAKPWRREVYLQSAPYPHPVLAHELAHVVAGSFGTGPFRIAGRWGGLLPDPGLIEGVAVAAAPDRDVLSDVEWSRAMLELAILPRLDTVFSLGFLGESSAKGYTVAGAVVAWLMETRGAEAVRALYGGRRPEDVLGTSWAGLDQAFRAYLRTVPFSPDVLAVARARFDRPAVFGRKCPHEVDALVHEATACRDSLKFEKALGLYADALSKNAHEMPAILGKGVTHTRMGEFARARVVLEALVADEKTPRTTRDRAEEALADTDIREGRFTEGADRYRALASRVIDEDFGRTLEVKALLSLDPLSRASLEALLLGVPGRAPDVSLGLARLQVWRAATGDPLADYLLGRNLLTRSAGDALGALRRAAAGPLPTARIRREAAKQLVIAACITREDAALMEARAVVERERAAGAPGGYLDEVSRQLGSCAPAPAR